MKCRPILFSGPMVRALLDGRKTQTRRVCKHIGPMKGTPEYTIANSDILCPYGRPGDLLWVRETYKRVASGQVRDGYGEVRYGAGYQADGETKWQPHVTRIWDLTGQPDRGPLQFKPQPWKPSIHMPRWANRLTLEINGVRVERLQDISEADAIAEGMVQCESGYWWYDATGQNSLHRTAASAYQELWRELNGPGSWDVNPWVWVLEFKVHRCNVDELLKARAA